MPHNEHSHIVPGRDPYTGQGAFRFWCQKVLPLVYDDSLSYMELLCKVVTYLNNVIKDVATMEDNVDELYSAFAQLQDYVNTYFDNLDLEEEVRKILDEMAESGELTALLQPLVDAGLPSLVEEGLPGVVEDQLDGVVAEQLPGVFDSRIGAQLDAKLPGLVDSKLPDVVEDQLPDVVEEQLPDVVDAKVAARLPGVVEDLLSDVVEDQLSDVVETQLPSVVDTKLPDVVDTALPDVVDTKLPAVVDTKLPAVVEDVLPDVAEPIIHDELPGIVEEKFPGEIEQLINDIFPVPTSSDEGMVPVANGNGEYVLGSKGIELGVAWEESSTQVGEDLLVGKALGRYYTNSSVSSTDFKTWSILTRNIRKGVDNGTVAVFPQASQYSQYRYYILHTTDFVTFTQVKMGSGNNSPVVAYGNNKFVAYSGDRTVAKKSTDGTTWTNFTPDVYPYDVVFDGTNFICMASGGTYESTDGATWVNLNSYSIGADTNLYMVGNTVCAIQGGATDNYNIRVLSDGDWIVHEMPVSGRNVFAVDGVLYGHKGNKNYMSTDGVAWKLIPAPGNFTGSYGVTEVVAITDKYYYGEKALMQDGVNVTEDVKELLGIE